MDVTGDDHMQRTEDERRATDEDFPPESSEEEHRPLGIGEVQSDTYRNVGGRVRPRLQWTKSFPPYSQCIGGLGETSNSYHSSDGTENGNEKESAGCTGDGRRAMWTEGFSGIEERRADKTDEERDRVDKGADGGADRERRSDEMYTKGGEENDKSRGNCERTDGVEVEEPLRRRSGTNRPSHNPFLSWFLRSSSSTSSNSSSCSSVNFSSAESDDVLSEGEEAGKKRQTLRKCRSWKTYLTMRHGSMEQSSWVQLAGHQGNVQLSEGGEVLKLYSEQEAKCLESLMRDPLRPFVPLYYGTVSRGERCYIRLEDLLSGHSRPVIMDCKMGVRTYQEEELVKARTKATLRSDMYQKLVKMDPSALSTEEHTQRGITKLRYLEWRDATTSTAKLGFRIEAIMMEDGTVHRDFRNILTLAQVTEVLLFFTRSQLDILKSYHSRLVAMSDALMNSPFFRTHEVIGSSLLFVHDHRSKANVWMIDFGKTTPVHDTIELHHNIPWSEGNREDGYLVGLSSLVTSLSRALGVASFQQENRS